MRNIKQMNLAFIVRIRAFLIIMIFPFPHLLCGQGLKVKEFNTLPFDISASTQQRQDCMGIPCGLIKVLIDDPNIAFDGEVVGSVNNKINEYWVYISKGAKCFVVKRNLYLPMMIKFSDYGIEEIESKVTYQLILKEESYNPDKNSLVVNVKPQTASLDIDGIIIDRNNDGSYRLLLEKGEHVCRLTAKGYRSKMEMVRTGKAPQTLNVELESLMAKVKIDCETTDADIYVNNKRIGVGTWEGNLPAGDYTIEAHKSGHKSEVLAVSLSEKEERVITMTKLTRDVFPFYIKSTPSECFMRKVKLDGKLIGGDSICATEISAGRHLVEVEITGCFPRSEKMEITSTDTLIIDLTPKTNEYKKAYQNDISTCVRMVRNTYEGESLFWGDKACDLLDNIDKNTIKSIWSRDHYEWAFLIDLYQRKKEEKDKAYRLLEKLESCGVDAKFLADCYYGMKDYKKAIIWYQRSIKESYLAVPQMSDHYWRIGICYKELGDYKKAIEFGNKAEQKYSSYVPPKEFLAECYLHEGNREMAIKWYRSALRCFISGNYFGQEQFLEKMKELKLYDAVVNGIL